MAIQTPLWKTAIFAGDQQTQFLEFLRNSQSGKEYIERLLKGCFDPPTLRFFLSACSGVEQDNWSSLVTGSEPGLSKQDITEIKRFCIGLSNRLDRVYAGDFEESGPGVYMEVALHERLFGVLQHAEMENVGIAERTKSNWIVERIRLKGHAAGLLHLLPLQLEVLHDYIDSWYAVTHGGGRPGLMPIRRDALLAHFSVYAKQAARLTHADLAFLISGTRKALKVRKAEITALSVKQLVGNYCRQHRADAAAMKQSVESYLRRRQTRRRNNGSISPYVVALGYVTTESLEPETQATPFTPPPDTQLGARLRPARTQRRRR